MKKIILFIFTFCHIFNSVAHATKCMHHACTLTFYNACMFGWSIYWEKSIFGVPLVDVATQDAWTCAVMKNYVGAFPTN